MKLPTHALLAVAASTGALALTVPSSVQNACAQLQSAYPKELLMPNSSDYESERINFWDIRSNKEPACIFLPTTADAVAEAVTIFHKEKAQFAIRGGGHMNYPGSNNIDNGILVGLNGLKQLDVNLNKSTIDVGAGAKWVDVYTALAPHGLYTIGGRLKTIGVPGLTLIGGVGYFLNKYGFTMDNVVSYDVVLGNGTQVVASQKSNPDLFWALKGGGSSFGLVTKFELKAYDVPLVSSTYQIFDQEHAHDFIRAACEMLLSEDGSRGAGAVININYNATTKKATPQVFGLEETTESPPPKFSAFSAIPAVSRTNAVMPPVEWHSRMETPNQMFRIQFGHHTIKPDAEQLIYIYDQWIAAIDEIVDVPGILPTFILNFAPKSAVTVSKRNGIGNTFGLNDDQSYIWWQFTTSWANEEDDLRVTAWQQHHLARLHEDNRAKGLATDFLYMGDAAEWQDPIQTYGKKNIQRMRKIRDAYDPDLTFTKLNWGGFKLGY
ncbi:hypothetical protein CDV31_011465 [Fusarium ambrosium]|uniref:FAD-binding PCMH-type domain-containing protein n=1 Tax=Fusarium ambrosium TaxID=131363 RepID=A0A428TGH1_9HYPO|nr:hypothetical protein CDV31_011465 [Fusarium ambrosium]